MGHLASQGQMLSEYLQMKTSSLSAFALAPKRLVGWKEEAMLIQMANASFREQFSLVTNNLPQSRLFGPKSPKCFRTLLLNTIFFPHRHI